MNFYTENADEVFARYESVDPSTLYPTYLPEILQRVGGRVLDVGAGSGRDAAWFRRLGFKVIASEPNDALRTRAMETHGDGISWSAASLPDLVGVETRDRGFDIVFCNGVFMHVTPGARYSSLERLSDLLADDGVLCLGFRAVTDVDLGRGMYPIHVLEVSAMATDLGLRFQYETTGDVLGRTDIAWWTCTIRRQALAAS